MVHPLGTNGALANARGLRALFQDIFLNEATAFGKIAPLRQAGALAGSVGCACGSREVRGY